MVVTTELVISILRHLCAADLSQTAAVCALWRGCVNDERLWHTLCRQKWRDTRLALEDVTSWKAFYARRAALDRPDETTTPCRDAAGVQFMVTITEIVPPSELEDGHTRTVLARSFHGRSARPSCLGSAVGFSWPTRMQAPMRAWPEGFERSEWRVALTAFRAADQKLCRLLHDVRLTREQARLPPSPGRPSPGRPSGSWPQRSSGGLGTGHRPATRPQRRPSPGRPSGSGPRPRAPRSDACRESSGWPAAVPLAQVERSCSGSEQIIDAIVSARVPILPHVFDRPGFAGHRAPASSSGGIMEGAIGPH